MYFYTIFFNKNKVYLYNYKFIDTFSKLSYKIFNEGFLIDFNQKKIVNRFLKKSIFLTFFLFYDKFIFEKISYNLIDSIVWSKNYLYVNDFKSPNFMFSASLLIIFISVLLYF